MINNNRKKTLQSVKEIMQQLSADDAEFASLPYERRFQLAMQFYGCERGRLQKAKMLLDIPRGIGPLILAGAALLVAWFKT